VCVCLSRIRCCQLCSEIVHFSFRKVNTTQSQSTGSVCPASLTRCLQIDSSDQSIVKGTGFGCERNPNLSHSTESETKIKIKKKCVSSFSGENKAEKNQTSHRHTQNVLFAKAALTIDLQGRKKTSKKKKFEQLTV
jgi:hypothetical protein